jgi:hypothetical protein
MTQPLSEEELALLNTPEADIVEQHRPLSFDTDRFSERTANGPPWQQLIQAHLYLDHTISLCITDALAKPDAMNMGRMSFAQKLQLVDGMACSLKR